MSSFDPSPFSDSVSIKKIRPSPFIAFTLVAPALLTRDDSFDFLINFCIINGYDLWPFRKG